MRGRVVAVGTGDRLTTVERLSGADAHACRASLGRRLRAALGVQVSNAAVSVIAGEACPSAFSYSQVAPVTRSSTVTT